MTASSRNVREVLAAARDYAFRHPLARVPDAPLPEAYFALGLPDGFQVGITVNK
jgi:hypothetical protein